MTIYLISDADLNNRIRLGCRAKRLAIELSQSALAKKAGLALRTVRNFEKGDPISFISLMKLMRALGEFNRLEALVIEAQESPREQFIKSKSNKNRPVSGKN